MTKSQGKYTIRRMNREDLSLALGWAANEGWNPGLHDTQCFYNTDPNGFFMGFLDDKPISSISAVKYDRNFGFLGLYIVKKGYRNQGFGWKIWNHAMEYLKDQNIGLDGVVTQQNNYKKSGFKLYYRNIRFQGKSKKYTFNSENIRNCAKIHFEDLLQYDNHLFPSSRSQFFKCWLNMPESKSLCSVINEKITGYGVIRICRTGYKIGPLFADNFNIAENILLALNNSIEPEIPIYLDTPDINPDALKIASKYQMTPMFETARMYSKYMPEIPMKKIFGVTTFELG